VRQTPLDGHVVPHDPQLFGSLDTSTQVPLHSVCPGAQAAHVPL
jgi:hypothetical protein